LREKSGVGVIVGGAGARKRPMAVCVQEDYVATETFVLVLRLTQFG